MCMWHINQARTRIAPDLKIKQPSNATYLAGLFNSRSLGFMGGSDPMLRSGLGGQYSPDKTSRLLSSLRSVFEMAGFCHLPPTYVGRFNAIRRATVSDIFL